MKKLTTRQIALIAIFAALIVAIDRIPGIPIIGGGGQIKLSVFLYPVIGIILGPWIGLLATFLGNIITWIIPTSTVFGLLTIPAGAIAAFVSGCSSQSSGKLNWKAAAGVLASLDALWYFTPVGLAAPFYPVLHFAALALILLFRNKISEYIHSPLRSKNILGTAICSYAGTMSDHIFGNLVFISSVGLVIPLKTVRDAINVLGIFSVKLGFSVPSGSIGDLFMLVFPISAVERFTYTALATILGVSLIRVIGWGRILASVKSASKD